MKPWMRQWMLSVTAVLGTALLVAGGCWWWFGNMEQRWVVLVSVSDAAQENPMLAAARLLGRYRHPVTTATTLGNALAKPLSPGTLLIADHSGILTLQQTNRLLAWVAQGNTLIASPKRGGKDLDANDQEQQEVAAKGSAQPAVAHAAAPNAADPLGAHFGVRQIPPSRKDAICRAPGAPVPLMPRNMPDKVTSIECIAEMMLPGAAYPLRVDTAVAKLGARRHASEMTFGDRDGQAVRVYGYGKGRVVFIAHNYFDNDFLPMYDHAELLLGLADLNRAAAPFLIVQRLDVLSWYGALWAGYPLAIVSMGAGLLLLMWTAVRRFGPMLPDPDLERRSLMEHVDAGGRWLWKTAAGRATLLAAARAATGKTLVRRVPELHRLPPEQQIQYLAERCGLAAADLESALHGLAVRRKMFGRQMPLSVEFTRQIQTLQRLKKHFEPIDA